MRRRADGAVDAVGEQRGVGRLELHRGVVQEIVAHQHGIVIGADQRGSRRQVRIGGHRHQHGVIGAGEGRLGSTETDKRQRRRREESARTFPLHHFGCLPSPNFEFPKCLSLRRRFCQYFEWVHENRNPPGPLPIASAGLFPRHSGLSRGVDGSQSAGACGGPWRTSRPGTGGAVFTFIVAGRHNLGLCDTLASRPGRRRIVFGRPGG